MSTAVIVAEYNPLHNGHKYHIEQTRLMSGADNIAVIMSGNFVQRGEPAVLNKYTRARHAVLSGADIVIELPCFYALSSAAYFADAAVRTASLIKGVTHLSFGSECGDLKTLERQIELSDSAEYARLLRAESDKGLSYAVASQNARKILNGADFLPPNDTLGIEYLKAIKKHAPYIKPITVKRLGSYNQIEIASDKEQDGGVVFASAAAIRGALANGGDIAEHIPQFTFESLQNAPKIDINRLFSVIATRIFDGITDVYEDNEGLLNRVKKALVTSRDYENLLNNTHTKRYTKSRIRRFLLHIALKQTNRLLDCSIDYARVLAVNSDKRQLLGDVLNRESDSELYGNDLSADRLYELIASDEYIPDKPLFVKI